jgi:hypothetical protein
MNNGKFDGGLLDKEKELRDFYKRLLNFSINSSALMGEFGKFKHSTVSRRQVSTQEFMYTHAGRTLKN